MNPEFMKEFEACMNLISGWMGAQQYLRWPGLICLPSGKRVVWVR